MIPKLIEVYQKYIDPFLISHCRFFPSCSEYTKQAINTFGLPKGVSLAAKRILKCHPFCEGGYDPIPTKLTKA